jgi:beta-1,4-mannosyltransferase
MAEERQSPPVLHGRRVAVVVLGDFGRSPRMMYHASSLLSVGSDVTLIGYSGTPLIEELRRADKRFFEPFEWRKLRNFSYMLFALLKLAAIVVQLSWALLTTQRPDAILVQNPPSAALPIVVAIAVLRGSSVIVDWHNLGFTTLALAIGCGKEFSDVEGAPPGAPRSLRRRLVQVAMRIEGICARRASAHLAVTHAMSTWLSRNLGIEANRFHDSPPDFFKSTVVAERHDLFTRLRPE